MDVIIKILEVLWPFREPGESRRAYKQRAGSAMLLLVTAMFVVGQSLLTWGYVSVFGFTGFASATEQREILTSQEKFTQALKDFSADNQASIIDQQIFNLQIMQCANERDKNEGAAMALAARIADKEDDLRRLNRPVPPRKTCPELGFLGAR